VRSLKKDDFLGVHGVKAGLMNLFTTIEELDPSSLYAVSIKE
jgi:hypothetical protein